jgi:hypothetical protein
LAVGIFSCATVTELDGCRQLLCASRIGLNLGGAEGKMGCDGTNMEWSIQARAHACQNCGHTFRPREALHTLLLDEHQAYHRLDVCETCWKSQYAEGANHRRGFVSHWVTAHVPPAPPAPEPIRRDTAEILLRKLLERNDPTHTPACFILAVMLERKRLLKIKAQTEEGDRRVFVYEHPKSGDVFTIADPGLHLDQLEAVQRDVAHLLEHGLDAPPPAAPAAEPVATGGAQATAADTATLPASTAVGPSASAAAAVEPTGDNPAGGFQTVMDAPPETPGSVETLANTPAPIMVSPADGAADLSPLTA